MLGLGGIGAQVQSPWSGAGRGCDSALQARITADNTAGVLQPCQTKAGKEAPLNQARQT